MKLNMYQVDAFAANLFEGNPAAVCPLEKWLDDDLLQKIAEENNLSETAFFVALEQGFSLRWFTPVEEVDLCGHATLATAHVLYHHLGYSDPEILFQTRSGELVVSKSGNGYQMEFPISPPEIVAAPEQLLTGLGITPEAVLKAYDYILVLDNEAALRALTPNFTKWSDLDSRGVIVTAPATEVDFVARCFFPGLNINEDPVTGSAYCELAPYWSDRLGKTNLTALQLSKRGGVVQCQLKGHRIFITGTAIDFMKGEMTLPD